MPAKYSMLWRVRFDDRYISTEKRTQNVGGFDGTHLPGPEHSLDIVVKSS